MTRLADSHTG